MNLLKKLYEEDQSERWKLWGRRVKPRKFTTKEWGTMRAHDRKRRAIVKKLIRGGKVKIKSELFYAAVIFQHGTKPEHFKLANQLTTRSMKMGYKRARWLYAATLDRWLMSCGKPQKFGTQFNNNNKDKKWLLYKFDPRTTNAERKKYNVRSLEKQLRRVELMNAK